MGAPTVHWPIFGPGKRRGHPRNAQDVDLAEAGKQLRTVAVDEIVGRRRDRRRAGELGDGPADRDLVPSLRHRLAGHRPPSTRSRGDAAAAIATPIPAAVRWQ